MQNNQSAIQILRLKEVVHTTGISRSSLYEKLNPKSRRYDPSFPTPIKIGASAVGWFQHELNDWLLSKKA
ncbi:AlpA family phage regulatory protein [Acinetobacter sp. ANC 4633]|uniref:helix-turn-helix transcriptional regulator n=1 Tax=Acinetobacter sp. ANC 4633 TaxID=2529845 RepID=UPI00103ECDC6|nr:AlpA family phage regulatory protein [Acinetobacter sp. ANC 4633]TCB27132.1 AlpA family phage regulatory protein [Acinetobacter sp. ANC 4633]